MTRRTTTHRTTMYPGYDLGCGRLPRHTRFQKGQSGTSGGGGCKRGLTEERAKPLALKGPYRNLKVQDAEDTATMLAIQPNMRSQVALATKRNGPAQRAVVMARRVAPPCRAGFSIPCFFPASEGNRPKPPRRGGQRHIASAAKQSRPECAPWILADNPSFVGTPTKSFVRTRRRPPA
jgi:hypothetical protein